MKLFRFIFDCTAFLIVLLAPRIILITYVLIHVWCPWIVRLPVKFDRIQYCMNVRIPFTAYK